MPTETTPLIAKAPSGNLRQVLIAGTGFLADAYDLFVVDLAIACLHIIHPLAPMEKSLIAAATLTGAAFGQVFFGILADWFGRRQTFIWTCLLIIAGGIGSAFCQWHATVSLVIQLALCRFLLGVGVGGEYPISASITAENASLEHRGALIAAVFSMQGWGVLLSTGVMLIGIVAQIPLDFLWRISLAFGAIPTVFVIYFRAQMKETEPFQLLKKHSSFFEHLRHAKQSIQTHWRELFGTTATWFLLDVTFYGTGSFKTRIGEYIVSSKTTEPLEQLRHQAVLATFLALMALPGYLLSIAFIDKIGFRRLQIVGFYCMAVNFMIVSLLNTYLHPYMLVFFFGLTFLFSNFGPNTTTFVIPATCYPTHVRSTCHGLSAASGKIGAVVGAGAFSPLDDAFGLRAVLFMCSLVCLLGAGISHMFTSDRQLE